jgi:NAD+ diphosphatase
MIQDISPRKMYNQFRPGMVPDADSPVFLFADDKMKFFMTHVSEGRMRYPVFGELPDGISYTYLFSIDDDKYFMGTPDDPETFQFPEGLTKLGIRELRSDYYRGEENRHLIFAAYTAGQLAGWYRDNRYCGTCAHMTVPSQTERALVCPNCGRIIYPRILPAVIIAVTDGDRMIMTKYAGRSLPFYALVAGFNEIGESLEETVKREVMEETGVKVKDIRYYKSQPWGFASNLLLGFFARLDGDDQITLDRQELSEARFVKREEIDVDWDDVSLTNEMIIKFKQGKTESL